MSFKPVWFSKTPCCQAVAPVDGHFKLQTVNLHFFFFLGGGGGILLKITLLQGVFVDYRLKDVSTYLKGIQVFGKTY